MITISYPRRGMRMLATLQHTEGKALKYYFKEVPGLMSSLGRCRRMKQGTHERLRLSYVPQDGELILLELAGR